MSAISEADTPLSMQTQNVEPLGNLCVCVYVCA